MKSQALTRSQTTSWPTPAPKTISVKGERLAVVPDETEAQKTDRFLQIARERFKLCVDAENRRRAEMQIDLRFRAGDQWDPVIRARREGGATPRPCLTINRIPGFVKHVVNNMRQSRPAIKVLPVGDGDEEQAEIRQGLIRHIEVNSQADATYDTAFEAMCIMGLGWMRVVDDWAAPDSFDQELFIRWVLNPFSVYSDPNAVQPDWSDMKFAFVVDDLTKEEFIAQFGEDTLAASLSNFQSIGDHQEYWFPGGKIRVAEYFRIEYEKDTLLELSDGTTVLFSKLGELPQGVTIQRRRECKVPQVYWSLISAVDKLRERKWRGRFIPLIPVIGNQIYLDGEKLLVGMVRYAREPQRLYNYMYSTLVETVALAPRSQFIATMEQIEPYRDMYERANVEPMAVLPYVARTTEQGQLLPPPQRVSPAVDIASFVEGLQVADQQLKSVFSIYDASLGQRGPQESGLAINARKIESDTGTYDWGDNFIRSLRHLGTVIDDLLPYYYNTPGRIIHILRDDETREPVVLNQQHQGKDGQPKLYNLDDGKFSVVITTGPSQQTKRQEAATSMVDLAKVYPAIMQVAGDILVKELDWPGKDAIAKRLEKALPPGIKDPDPNAPPLPPEVQQQLSEMQQMIQQLTAALHEATDKKELERMKQEYETLRTQMTQEVALAIGQLKTGSQEATFMNEKIFQELERVRAAVEGQLAPQSSARPQTSGGEQPGGGQ